MFMSLDLKIRIYETRVILVFYTAPSDKNWGKGRKTNFSAGNGLVKKDSIGVFRLQKIRNGEIRSSLDQEETLCKRTQQRRD